jgi:hypothetical protein
MAEGLLDGAWGAWSDFWSPTSTPEGAQYDPEALRQARIAMISSLGANLLGASQGGLHPGQRAQFLAGAASAPMTYQDSLRSGAQDTLRRELTRAQVANLRGNAASRAAWQRLLLGDMAPMGGGGPGVAAPGGGPVPGDQAPLVRALQNLRGPESGGNPAAMNPLGFSGVYQMGSALAHDAGLYQPAEGEPVVGPDGRAANQWRGSWRIPGFQPMTHQQFLQNPQAQERAARLAMELNWGRIQGRGLDRYVGQTVGGVQVTPEALLQAAWMGGVDGAQAWVTGQQNRRDPNGASVGQWAALGGGGSSASASGASAAPSASPQGSANPFSNLTPQQRALLATLPPEQGAAALFSLSTQEPRQPPRLMTPEELAAAGLRPDDRVALSRGGISMLRPGRDPREDALQADERRFSRTSDLRTEFSRNPAVETFRQVAPQVQAIRQAAPVGNRAADIDIVFAFAKLLDPNSVVREGEQMTLMRTGGIWDTVQGWVGRLNGGQALTPDVRQNILQQAESRFATFEQPYRETVERYRGLAQRYRLDPDEVAPALPAEPQSRFSPAAEPAAPPAGGGGAGDAQPLPDVRLTPEQRAALPARLQERVRARTMTLERAREVARMAGIDPALIGE